MSSILDLQNIYLSFGNSQILNDINFTVENGEFLSLIGPSGCGKTSLLRILAGLEKPQNGILKYQEDYLFDIKRQIFIPPQKREFGFVFQNYDLWPHMTVFENIAFPLKMAKWSKSDITNRVSELIKDLRLFGLSERRPEQLSGGQKQRVAIARALSKQPKVILFDEPLSSLDADLRHDLGKEIKEVALRHSLTCVYVTHDRREAFSLSDRIILMKDGRVLQSNIPSQLYSHPSSAWVAKFMNCGNIFDSETIKRIDPKFSGEAIIPRNAIQINENKTKTNATIDSCIFFDERYEVIANIYGKKVEFYHDKPLSINTKVLLSFDKTKIKILG